VWVRGVSRSVPGLGAPAASSIVPIAPAVRDRGDRDRD
jgi:hypothetical protein